MNTALSILLEKRAALVKEFEAIRDTHQKEIAGLDLSIEILSGRKANELIHEDRYDDENPAYMKNNEDGI